ncbi:hypothetical protein [Sabulicella rubraurantiaca]|uniref:hypothetical protein n=1 Tax=Sabulicella rubraurantiaca TaxID=2811429 RepID=UPI001A95EBA4|nr:hypothetical protein [Sabulicella rubraurantiaca]
MRWGKEVLPGAAKPAVGARYLSSIGQLDPMFGTLRMEQISPERDLTSPAT